MNVEYNCWQDYGNTYEVEIPNVEGVKSFGVSYDGGRIEIIINDVIVFESPIAGSDFSVEGIKYEN